jgi:hypothetical protein
MTLRPTYEVLSHKDCPHCLGEGVTLPYLDDPDRSHTRDCSFCSGSGFLPTTVDLADAIVDLHVRGELPCGTTFPP